MLDFFRNYDKYEYCKDHPARFIGGLAMDIILASVMTIGALLLACIGYHFFVLL